MISSSFDNCQVLRARNKMLKSLLILTLSLVAVCQSAAAPRFSFASWVEDIIANPDGNHLSAEEAIAAFYASAPSGGTSRATGLFGLQRRDVACNEVAKTEAPVGVLIPLALAPWFTGFEFSYIISRS